MTGTAPTLEQIRDFKGKYPKQLWYLFGTEMRERFCFYGVRGMLTVYMVTQLDMGEKAANLQSGALQPFVYAFTFIDGVFADKILGFQKSLFWGASLMILGGFWDHCFLIEGSKVTNDDAGRKRLIKVAKEVEVEQ